MASHRQGTFGRTAGTFALGAALGSVLALLYAPASGTTTRKRIKMRLRTLRRSAVELREVANEKLNGARKWWISRVGTRNGRRIRRQPVTHHA